ncbi:MAG: hypothetical protein IH986_15325 [Planctomycetes bacterium]|nr:hypothetical protein [Planctomycetota bacterium]
MSIGWSSFKTCLPFFAMIFSCRFVGCTRGHNQLTVDMQLIGREFAEVGVLRGLLCGQGDGLPRTPFDAIEENATLHIRDLTEAMGTVLQVHVSEVFVRDCVELVRLTRDHEDVELGSSPRAALALVQASRARAFIHGRKYTIPEDFFALAADVILHRMRLKYEALAAGRRQTDVLEELLRTLA